VNFQKELSCGGAYVKLLTSAENLDKVLVCGGTSVFGVLASPCVYTRQDSPFRVYSSMTRPYSMYMTGPGSTPYSL
jgi:non-ribosomal peptide synthetase component E (peptide arylation enzyme)